MAEILKDGVSCHFVSAVTAGFCTTLLGSPVDVVKTRIMNGQYRGQYRGVINCTLETGRNEGFLTFYKGFNASFTRLVHWNVCLWVSFEQFKIWGNNSFIGKYNINKKEIVFL